MSFLRLGVHLHSGGNRRSHPCATHGILSTDRVTQEDLVGEWKKGSRKGRQFHSFHAMFQD